MVGHGEEIEIFLLHHFSKNLISKLSGHGFQGFLFFGAGFQHIHVFPPERNGKFQADVPNHLCFFFCSISQVMIDAAAAESDMFPLPDFIKKKKKAQGIRTAGNSGKNPVSLTPQTILAGKGEHLLQKNFFFHLSSFGFSTSASRRPSDRSRSLTMISGRAKYSIMASSMARPATMMSALEGMRPVM